MSSVMDWILTPSQPRRVSPNWRSWSMTTMAVSDGHGKADADRAAGGEMMAVFTPMTSPSMLNSGPPELPLLMAASVCR